MSDESEIISRRDARAVGVIHYMTGKPCKHGHVARRLVVNGSCCACVEAKRMTDEYKVAKKEYRVRNKGHISAKGKAAYAANPEPYKARASKRYAENKAAILGRSRSYAKKHQERLKTYIRDYMRNRKSSDTQFRMKAIIRNLLWRSITATGMAKPGKSQEVLGYSPQQLREHLEPLFQRGMSWGNYGAWHVDHIRPLSTFDLATVEGIRLANSLHNLQPLWAKKNLQKSAKWSGQLTLV